MKLLIAIVLLQLSMFSFGQVDISKLSEENLRELIETDTFSFEDKSYVHLELIDRLVGKVHDTIVEEEYQVLIAFSRSKHFYKQAIGLCDSILMNLPSLEDLRKKEIRIQKADLTKTSGDSGAAMKIYLSVLSDYESAGQIEESAKLNRKIGIVFKKMGALKDAKYHLNESIDQSRTVKNEKAEAQALMVLGNCFKKEKQFEEAEEAYQKSMELCDKNNFRNEMAGNYNNLGSLKRMMGKSNEAMKYYMKAVTINKETGNEQWLSYNYNNIGRIHKDNGQYQKALYYYSLSNDIKDKINDGRGKVGTMINLAEVYKLMGDYKSAFEAQDLRIRLEDSISKVDNLEHHQKLSAEFQADKKEAEIVKLNIQDELNQERIRSKDERISYQNFVAWLLGIGVFLFILVAIVLWRSVVNKKRSNTALEQKNQQIELKNNLLDDQHQEITSSINYAQRIQRTILPSDELLKKSFQDVSILYMPRDIVSGDVYLCHETEDGVFFGVVDCTGHGVPGAMVSLVGASYFNKAIHELHMKKPNEILDYLNVEIPKAFDSGETMINDGMDVSLGFIDKQQNKLLFSGANHNCWVINSTSKQEERKNESHAITTRNENSILEIKGDRQWIGKSSEGKPFTLSSLDLDKGDRIVLFTDGYPDQFGGPKNKKFKVSKFRDLLLDNQGVKATDAIANIEGSFIEWKGQEMQVDDVCVMILDI